MVKYIGKHEATNVYEDMSKLEKFMQEEGRVETQIGRTQLGEGLVCRGDSVSYIQAYLRMGVSVLQIIKEYGGLGNRGELTTIITEVPFSANAFGMTQKIEDLYKGLKFEEVKEE